MWLDHLERDVLQAQETEVSLAQQYQVSVCAVYTGADGPIISLISGITLWGSGCSRHIFSQSGLFLQASGYIPYSAACGISLFSLHIIQIILRI